MKKLKNNILKALIKCWHEVSISDKSLILIMIILLFQCVHNLFTPEPITPNKISVNVVVRTSVASIFGYFLSENFLKTQVVKSKTTNLIIPLNQDDNENANGCINKDENSPTIYTPINKEVKNYICNKTVQILIAVIVCIISLLCLIIGNNLNLIPYGTNPTVVQFRDLISSCLGFLLGHSRDSNKNDSNN